MKCKFCEKECKTNQSLSHHQTYCKNNPNRLISTISNNKNNAYQQLFCRYCAKECHSLNSLKQHECRCKNNPNRKAYNQLTSYIINNIKGHNKFDRVSIKKQSETMKKKYQSGYIHPNTGIGIGFKCGWYKGYWCDSSWELAFLIYNLEHNVNILRNSTPFVYYINNERHTYYPDFIIDNCYYEIKGQHTNQTDIKLNAVKDSGKDIKLLEELDIQPYLNYCISKYGKNFYELYDKDKPSFRNYS